MSALNRRVFVRAAGGTAAFVGMGGLAPGWTVLSDSAQEDERVLVVIQLSGGNDGLNTVIPANAPAYQKHRPTLAIRESEALRIDDHNLLHPSLSGMAELYEDGALKIVHGVGYETPNRSHFESMDIWHSCTRNVEQRRDGWLGRYVDALFEQESTRDMAAIHLGEKKQPLALSSLKHTVASITSLEEFRLKSRKLPEFQSVLEDLSSGPLRRTSSTETGGLLSFVQDSTATALSASRQIRRAEQAKSSVEYPEHPLGEKLSVIAKLIDSGLKSRVYYVELDGFDTHAKQAEAHAILLRQWSDALFAFQKDLDQMGHSDRVCTFTFSEFGRRVAENASGGTDHGAAAPVFVSGKNVNAGVLGDQPSLDELVDGDLKYAVDFRQIYASILEQWFQSSSIRILGNEWDALPIFS